MSWDRYMAILNEDDSIELREDLWAIWFEDKVAINQAIEEARMDKNWRRVGDLVAFKNKKYPCIILT